MSIMYDVIKSDFGLGYRNMKWIKVEDALPSKDTRYAGEFGVSVLTFDDSDPNDYGVSYMSYNFEHKLFLTLAPGLDDPIHGDWFPMGVSHWMELPAFPIRDIK